MLCGAGQVMAQSIVGSWIVPGQNTRAEGAEVLVFLANNYYFQIQNAKASDAPASVDGFELGTYSWNAQTGALSFVTVLDTNGENGVSAPGGASGFHLSVAGETAIVVTPGSQSLLFTRVTSSIPIVGGWLLGNPSQPNASGVVVFLPNGVYFLAQDAEVGATDGIEHGTYSWNEETGQLASSRSPAPFVDTQTEDFGLSALGSETTFTVLGETLRIEGGETAVLERVGSSPVDPADFRINAGLDGAWYNPDTDGQGFFISVFPEIGQLFLAWFTYDVERPPGSVTADLGDPGHRWLTAFGAYSGNQAELDIDIAEGGIFDDSPPVPSHRGDGTITLDFSGCNAGTVTYEIPSIGKQGVVPIERLALDNMLLCESLGARLQQIE